MRTAFPAAVVALVVLLAGCRTKADPAEQAARNAEEAEGLYIQATTEFLSGHQDEALRLLDACKRLVPEDPRLPAAYGEVYFAMRKLKESQASFEEATRRAPQRSTNWTRLGTVQFLTGQQAAAEESFRKALEHSPTDFNALEGLGEAALKAGRVDEAVKHLVAAAQSAPDSAKPQLLLRAADALADKGRGAEAAGVLKEAVGRLPRLGAAVFARLGELSVLTGDLETARVAYERAAEADPQGNHWELVGELRLRDGQLDDAEKAFRNALTAGGESAIIRVQLARLALKRDNRAAAELELQNALTAAKGEDRRESTELAALLVEMDRQEDAFKLLSVLSAEPESAKDAPLQLQVARLAHALGRKADVSSACGRARDAGAEACP